MASTSFALSSGYHTGILEAWESDVNVNNNTSVVHARLTINASAWGYSTSVTRILRIEGVDVYNQAAGINFGGAGSQVVAEGAMTVAHNSDGTKTVNVQGFLTDNVSYVFNGSGGLTMGLTTIPRCSSGSFDKSTYKIGDTIRLNFNRASGSFTHEGYIQFPDINGWVWDGVKHFSGAGTSYSWTPTATEIATLYSKIPSSTSAVMFADCKTMNGGTEIGRFSCGPATMTVNEEVCRPAFQDFFYKDTDEKIAALTGNDQILVQGKSKLRVTIPKDYKATGMYSASMKSYEAAISGISQSDLYSAAEDVNIDFSSSAFTPGTQTLSCLARDSRNITTKITKSVQVIAYADPTIQASAEREGHFENATTLSIKGTYSPLTIEGEAKNTIVSVKYRYKAQSTTQWSDWADMAGLSVTDAGAYTTTDKILDLDNTKSFDFEVQVTDKIGTVTSSLTVSVGIPIFRIGTDGFVYNNEQPLMVSHVGQVIMSTTLDTAAKVEAIYGGKWEAWGKGRVPVGVDPNDPDFNAPNKSGGSKTVTLTVEQMPKHYHAFYSPSHSLTNTDRVAGEGVIGTTNPFIDNTGETGGDKPHPNMPPYQTIYYWLRTV